MPQADWAREHIKRYRETGGADGHIWKGHDGTGNFPCLLLTTTGRNSDVARTTPLIYGRDGDDLVIIASQAGRPNHPAWFFNLERNPEVEVQMRGDRFAARAELLSDTEKDAVWGDILEAIPQMNVYEARTERNIPVIRLSRRSHDA